MKKKAIKVFEYSSDDYSSSDDNLFFLKMKKNISHPEKYSIDELIKQREKEKAEESIIKNVGISDSDDLITNRFIDFKKELSIEEISDFTFIDESIYFPEETKFENNVFSLLNNKPCDLGIKMNIDPSLLKLAACLSNIENCEGLIFSLLYLLWKTKDEEYGKSLLQVVKENSFCLNFEYYLYLFKKIAEECNEQYLIYPAILCSANNFAYCNNLESDIYLLQFALLSASSITSHNEFYHLLQNISFNKLEFRTITNIQSFLLNNGIDIKIISRIVSFIKITKDNAENIIGLYKGLINVFLNPDNLLLYTLKSDIDFLVSAICHLKEFINSNSKTLLLQASAILSLVERIFIASIIMNKITSTSAKKLIRSLETKLAYDNSINLVALKEQLHMTRVQIDAISQKMVFPHNPENIFYNPYS